MEKEFVPREESLELKELGFNEPCPVFYNKFGLCRYMDSDKDWNSVFSQCLKNSDIVIPDAHTAPTFSQAFRWFREKHSLYSCVNTFTEELNDDILYFIYEIRNPEQFELSEVYKTYEEAELACLKKLIEIVKNGK